MDKETFNLYGRIISAVIIGIYRLEWNYLENILKN